MQSMQRQFGKFTSKRSADDNQVAVLISDFNESDRLLGRIVESTTSWRDAWTATLSYQSRLVSEFNGLYAQILGSSEATSDRKGEETPEAVVARTAALRNEFEDLQTELAQELDTIEQRMIRPASQAKESLAPMKKTIKKREDRKLDFERCQSRYDGYAKKTKRTEKDNAAQAKAETDLAKATEEYNAADENLKQRLPPLISTTFSLLPLFLAAQIEIQNSVLATYYTVLHNYAPQYQFPSPAPEMDQIIQSWQESCEPIQQEVENFSCLAQSKGRCQGSEDRRNSGVLGNGFNSMRSRASGLSLPSGLQQQQQQQPQQQDKNSSVLGNGINSMRNRASGLSLPSGLQQQQQQQPQQRQQDKNSSVLGNGINNVRSRASGFSLPSALQQDKSSAPNPEPKSRINSTNGPLTSSSTVANSSYTATPASEPTPPPSTATTPAATAFSPAGPKQDYFVRDRQAAAAEHTAAIASKKKPPPPPPRGSTSSNALYVTALYDFGGQNAGDLAFREGDRILVVEKTESTDDWWEGELRGVKGSFPANYVG